MPRHSGRSSLLPRVLLIIVQCAAFLWLASVAAQVRGQDAEEIADIVAASQPVRYEWVTMRDGVRLWTSVRLPKLGKAPYPTVLVRTPYRLNDPASWYQHILSNFIANGYALVIQNERGRFWSEGHYRMLGGSRNDGYDTVDWVAKQPWSNGKIGTFGCSSSAENQLGLASLDHPAHAAAIPISAGAAINRMGPFLENGGFHRGGVFHTNWAAYYYKMAHRYFPKFPDGITAEGAAWMALHYGQWPELPPLPYAEAMASLPLKDIVRRYGGPPTDFDDFITWAPADPRWDTIDFFNEGDRWGVPALWVNQLYDVSIAPNVALFDYVRRHASDDEARDNQFMVITPLDHCSTGEEIERTVSGERMVGDARWDYNKLFTDWFDHWLKGVNNGVTDQPRVKAFVLGADSWKQYRDWPPKAKAVAYYLSGGRANSSLGNGLLARAEPAAGSDSFVYDPVNPVPSRGGGMCCTQDPKMQSGIYDQSDIELRNDVLIYSTPPLDAPVEVTGLVEVVLHVSSDAKDTDFTVKLLDVYPDGKAYNVDESIQRARYRNGYEKPEFMAPGGIYELSVGPLFANIRFGKGHRIRVEISSSSFPKFARGLNTDGDDFEETNWVVATNKVHFGPGHPSRIILPVISP